MTTIVNSQVFRACAWFCLVAAGVLIIDVLPLLSAWIPGKSDILLGYITGWVRLMSLVLLGLVILFSTLSGLFFWLSGQSEQGLDRPA